MFIKQIIQYTSVYFTIYPSPYSSLCLDGTIIDSSTILVTMHYYCGYVLGYDWWLCMVINISVQYSGGLSPRHYTVDPRLLPVGNPFKYHALIVALYLYYSLCNVLVYYYYHV